MAGGLRGEVVPARAINAAEYLDAKIEGQFGQHHADLLVGQQDQIVVHTQADEQHDNNVFDRQQRAEQAGHLRNQLDVFQ